MNRSSIIAFVAIMAIYFAVMAVPATYSSWHVYASNAVVAALAVAGILRDPDRAYSAKKFVFYFIFFFMGLAPLMQFKTGAQTVGGYDIRPQTYTLVNCIMIGVILLFELAYTYIYRHIHRPLMRPSAVGVEVSEVRWRNALLIIALGAALCTILFYHNELERLFWRGLSTDEFEIYRERTLDVYATLGLRWFVRPLIAVCCINYWVIGRNRIYKAVFVAVMLIAYCPTSLERLRAAVFYVALLIVMFPALKLKNRFSVLFLGGILVVFPLLSTFRVMSKATLTWPKLDFSMFCGPDYDSYQSFAFTLQNHFRDFSGQVYEFFLFWVPRMFWPDKPMPSGFRMAHIYDLDYDFIAMNYWSEGYILCGYAGIILFTIALAWMVAKLDRTYWHAFGGSSRNLFAPFYLFSLGLTFFVLRGDLVGGIVESATILGLNYLIYRISLRFLKSNRV